MEHSNKPLYFYIDDWGLSKEVNLATLTLVKRGVVRGVSLLSDSPYVDEGLDELLAFKDVKIGLHFNLTQSSSHWTKFLKHPSRIQNEIHRQFETLKERTKRINYIDGHHHIHLLPDVNQYVRSYAALNNVPIRVIDDIGHLGSFVLSKIYTLLPNSGSHFVCSYLIPSDLKIKSKFWAKCLRSREKPLVIHVATESIDQRPLSSFERFRHQQYIEIMDYLNEQF